MTFATGTHRQVSFASMITIMQQRLRTAYHGTDVPDKHLDRALLETVAGMTLRVDTDAKKDIINVWLEYAP